MGKHYSVKQFLLSKIQVDFIHNEWFKQLIKERTKKSQQEL